MEKFCTEQCTKNRELFFENHLSVTLTQRAYRQHFKVRLYPSQTVTNRLHSVASECVIGPYFENEEIVAETVNSGVGK